RSTPRGPCSVRPGRSGPRTSSRPRPGSTSKASAPARAGGAGSASRRSGRPPPGFTRFEPDHAMTPPPPDTDAPVPLSRYREQLRALYAALDEAVAGFGPTCRLSGRCCRFAEYGHTLFLSAPEAELLLADAPPPARPLDDGATCPWQDTLGRCTARDA